MKSIQKTYILTFILLFALSFLLSTGIVLANDEGAKDAGTVTSVSVGGTCNDNAGDWVNPTNAVTQNDTDAAITSNKFDNGNITRALDFTNFGFTIPNGDIIDGILFEADVWSDVSSSSGANDGHIQLLDVGGATTTSEDKASATAWPVSDSDVYRTYGGSTDLWTLSATDASETYIESTAFGVRLCAKATTANSNAQVDHGRITVYHSTPSAPTVVTNSASSITDTTATLNGDITATGGSNATDRGFAYGTDSTLATVIATTTESGSFGTGAFTFGASSLSCNTIYYNRAYATNSAGTGYGIIDSFTTSACVAVAPTLEISGTVYTDEGTTADTSTPNVKLAIATSTLSIYSTTTLSNGFWGFQIEVSGMATGAPMVAWIDNGTDFASAINKASSTFPNADIKNYDLYQNRVIARHEGHTATSSTIADFAAYDGDNNANIKFKANNGILEVNSGSLLYIYPGTEFKPGGEITIHGNAQGTDVDGSIRLSDGTGPEGVATSSMLTIESNLLTLAGHWFASTTALFNSGTATTTFNGTSTTQNLLGNMTGTSAFNHLEFSSTSAKVFLSNASTTNFWNNSNKSNNSATDPLNVHDSSGQGNDGSYYNATGTPSVAGYIGQALDFDGVDYFVDVGTLGNFGSELLNSETTFSMWAKPADTTVGVFAGTGNTGTSMVIQLIVNGDTEIAANSGWLGSYIRGSDGSAQDFSCDTAADTGINDGDWHHIVYLVDWNPGNIIFYVDGVLQGQDCNRTGTPVTTANFDFPLVLGANNNRGTNNEHYAGGLDDFRIYDRVLSSSEVRRLFDHPEDASLTEGLVGWWKFDAAATTTAPTLLSISGNYMNNAVFTNNSGTVYLSGSSQQDVAGVLTGNSAFNDLNILNNSGSNGTTSPSVVFRNVASTTGTFTAVTANTKIQFPANATSSVQNLTLDGQAVDTEIMLRGATTTGGVQFGLDVLGTDSISFTDFMDTGACGSAANLDATDGTSIDSGNNSCVDFVAVATLTLGNSATEETDQFTSGSVTNANLLNFQLTPSGGTVTIIQLDVDISLFGVNVVDITNVQIFVDYDGDGVEDSGVDEAIMGAGTVSTSTITFSTSYATSTSRNYFLQADISGIGIGNEMSLNLGVLGITTSSSISGTSQLANHIRSSGGAIGGGSVTGGGAPTGATTETGGGGEGGEAIGSEDGFVVPTGVATGDCSGTAQWTTPSNAFASDGNYATEITSTQSQDYCDFGFSIPGGNEITGIDVKIEASRDTDAGENSKFDIDLSWDGGTSYTTATTSGILPTTDKVFVMATSSDLWGRTWSPSELNDTNFRLRITASKGATTEVIQVDAIQIRVDHQAGGGGGGGGGRTSLPIQQKLAQLYAVFDEIKASLKHILAFLPLIGR